MELTITLVQLLLALIAIAVRLSQASDFTACDSVIQSLSGEIGSGNYTYHRLNVEGTLKIELESHTGDADLYISSVDLRPNFEIYELQSVTCGLDEILIGADMPRPIGVAVYGHVSNLLSTYTLTLYSCGDHQHYFQQSAPHHSAESESPLWNILINILKILLDVML